MPRDSDVLSHETAQIPHTHSCWCPCSSFRKQYYIFMVFGRRKKKMFYLVLQPV